MSSGSHADGATPVHMNDRLDDQPFDRTEQTVLEVARRFFCSFARPQGQAWLTAFETSERAFGPGGAALAMRVVRMIEALRASRTADFGFINPECPCCSGRITTEERYLISILHAVRRGHRSDALLYAMFVCGGANADALVEAVAALSRALDMAGHAHTHADT
ncbi:MAG: hypothetical protein AAF677_15225 [Pseudomonadota bacterium]